MSKTQRRIALVICLFVGLSGSTSAGLFTTTQPLSNAAADGLAHKTLVVTHYPPVHLSSLTSSDFWLWGSVGGVIAGAKEGKNVERSSGLQDPQADLASRLLRRLARERRMRIVTEDAAPDDSKWTDVPGLAAHHPAADYLLDVNVISVQFQYYPLDWSHYYLQFIARIRLIEVSSSSAIAEGTCQVKQENEPDHPTKDQLLADNAAMLKRLDEDAIGSCADFISARILGLSL